MLPTQQDNGPIMASIKTMICVLPTIVYLTNETVSQNYPMPRTDQSTTISGS